MIAHVVLFEPKSSTPTAERRQLLAEIRSVARNIPCIALARIGRTVYLGLMPEIIGRPTYQYAAIFEFATREDLATYLAHPVHDKLRTLFWDLCQATLIADVELVDPSSSDADSLV